MNQKKKSRDLLSIRCTENLKKIIKDKQSESNITKTAIVLNLLEGASMYSCSVIERADFPDVPAIYWVFTPTLELLYLGITENLNKQWGTHPYYQDFIEKSMATRVGWFCLDLKNPPKIDPNLAKFFIDTEIRDNLVAFSTQQEFTDLKKIVEDNRSYIRSFLKYKQNIEQLLFTEESFSKEEMYFAYMMCLREVFYSETPEKIQEIRDNLNESNNFDDLNWLKDLSDNKESK